MTVLARTICTRVAEDLNDEGYDRYTLAKLTTWLNEAQRVIVTVKPDANVTTAIYQLAAGAKQSIPDGTASFKEGDTTLPRGVVFQNVTRNMGTAGTTAGRVPRKVARNVLDAQDPNWHAATVNATIECVVYDPRNPRRFDVYPPQPSTGMGYAEIEYSSLPDDVDCNASLEAGASAELLIGDEYQDAAYEYMLFRAYDKDSGAAANAARAEKHLSNFMRLLGAKEEAETKNEAR